MNHIIDHTQTTSLGVIKLLNDLGYNICHIDNTFYVFSEFIPVEENITEITIRGKDITALIENQTDTIGVDKLRQRELVDKIDVMTIRRRVFSPGTPYSKYLSDNG